MNVLISEKRIKTAAKYKIADIPHPFTTREEYERSLQMPIGGLKFFYFSSLLICYFYQRGLEHIERCKINDTT
jgi:hypothetical protein